MDAFVEFKTASRSFWICITLCASAASAQSTSTAAEKTSEKSKAPLEVFDELRLKKIPHVVSEYYPRKDLNEQKEGWASVTMMVDTKGKPFEIMVIDSNGNQRMDEAAIDFAKTWEFKPASLNGQPVDSSFTTKVRFSVGNGVRKEFSANYKELVQALAESDRVKADTSMGKLDAENLFEDAYLGFAKFGYAAMWGTEEEQLSSLKRAIAGERTAKFLGKKEFAGSFRSLFQLQVRQQDFAGAMQSWGALQSMGLDKSEISGMVPIVEKLTALQTDNRAYTMRAVTDERGIWYLDLYKRHFRINVVTGHISEIKLRCQKKYVFFKFDPSIQYEVSDKFGTCSVQLIGDPASKFDFIQS